MIGAGRYAPSPSGDLHLGNLRTALIAWLHARATSRKFFLRIEDLDRDRDKGAAAHQLTDLKKLGLEWDEPVIMQSERITTYADVLAKLTELGYTYKCFCTRKEIHAAVTAPHTEPGTYPGTCRSLSKKEIAQKEKHKSPAVRLKLPTSKLDKTFTDELNGEITGGVDDFVLMRGDGTFAYNFVSVIDDGEMGVDQVVRGDDLLSSTARQVVLQEILDIPTPTYLHVPLVLNSTGVRLAKRDGAVTLKSLEALGIKAQQVQGYLLSTLGLPRADPKLFAVSRLSRDPLVFDAQQERELAAWGL